MLIIQYQGQLIKGFFEIADFLGVNYMVVEKSIDQLKSIDGFDQEKLISHLTLDEKQIGLKGIKKHLNSSRHKYHLITCIPSTAGGASYCVRDNRVDLVRINTQLGLKVFNKRYANRIVENDKLISIDCSLFQGQRLAKELRPLKRILSTFSKSDIHYFLTNLPDQVDLARSYRGLQAIGRIIGITNKASHPKHLLRRFAINKKKLNGEIPFPGVELNGS